MKGINFKWNLSHLTSYIWIKYYQKKINLILSYYKKKKMRKNLWIRRSCSIKLR